MFNIAQVRQDFPILHQQVYGKPLVYFDNAASTQKPQAVLDALMHYYTHDNANVHRGAHALADRATRDFEAARESVRGFLQANEVAEILWTKGTTEGINIVAQCYLKPILQASDKVMVSALAHHANFVPWQQLCQQVGAELLVIPVTEQGELDSTYIDQMLDIHGKNIKMVAITHVSNSLGTINPIANIIAKVKKVGATVLVDGAQAVAHFDIDVQALNCDFYVFSGHKLFAPTGIGVLYGKRELLEQMQVYQTGGEMIAEVTLQQTTFNVLPYKFEAGTPNIAGAIGLKAAIDYLDRIDLAARNKHETLLLEALTERAEQTQGLRIIGTAAQKTSVLSFVMQDMHCQDVGTLLNQQGIAVRTGHHCTMPIMQQFGLTAGTIRASIAFYNTLEEVDQFFVALEKTKMLLS